MLVLLVDGIICQMHILVIFVELGSVCLRGKSGQAFLVDVDSQRLVASDHHIDSQIKFIAVDEQRVGHVPRNDAELVHVEVVDIIDNVNSSTSARVAWLHNPDISARVRLLQLMIVIQQVSIFIGQYISVRYEIKVFSSEFLLHLDVIETQSVLPRHLVGVWKMIDPLVFIKTFIKIRLTAATGPEEIPFVGFGVFEIVGFADATHQLGVTF